ncbi:spore germination protein [Sutcliffiella cohnii]|uniref:spore germination protein n=1 Tax=Sutcliffiella cohnii TaxID=33932 RepID=UPI002E229B95|nr:spore germination protein [Sutcliffiella cohnii]
MKKPIPLSSLLKKKIEEEQEDSKEAVEVTDETSELYKDLTSNIEKIKQLLGKSNDITFRELTITQKPFTQGTAVFINNIVDEQIVNEHVLEAIIQYPFEKELEKENLFSILEKETLSVLDVNVLNRWDDIANEIVSGHTVLFVNGINEVVSCKTNGGNYRSIEEPSTEVTVRGPKEGFVESLPINISLVRRKIKSPDLQVEKKKLGKITKTNIAVLYVKSVANEKIVQEVMARLNRIEIDSILSSANIEELVQDGTFTPFPTVFNTERPDIVSSELMEGRVAIIVEGTPFVLIVPTSFPQFFKSAEDYYQRFDIASLIRILRYIAFTISLLGPSIYIALITFHQDLIPTTLLINLAAQREGIPFPALIEAFIMELTFEVLREAGIRMPRAIGQAVSIVGALVIGQAAVQAGIVSASMVIVVALTGIASFTTPSYNLAIAARMLRFFMMLVAATFGLYGVMMGIIVIVAHICSLRSFGVPYLYPIAPFSLTGQADGLIRAPLWWMKNRPHLISRGRTKNMPKDLHPTPTTKGDTNDST